MIKLIRNMLAFTVLFVLFSIPVNAETKDTGVDPVDEFLETFDATLEDLSFTDYNSVWDAYDDYFYTSSRDNLNEFDDFSFSGGLDYKKFSTFSDVKTLVGYGTEGTVVGLMVYKKVADEVILIDSSIKTLGPSGLYSENIEFECDQVQYVFAAVKQAGVIQSRIYQITTKKEATKAFLENIDIDFLNNQSVPLAVPDFELPVITDIEF